MLISVAILNYNYGHFVSGAIDCALAQTYRPIEIVVVDNGSTDDSWSRIEPYADRVHAVRHGPNAGVGDGYNVAFAHCHGEWLLFLDADDLLDADAIESCVALMQPDTSHVQLPLRLIDRSGHPLGGVVPYLHHNGDVVPIIRRFGHYAGPPSSGNLYRRSAIERYFPMSIETWRTGTDTMPFIVSAFHGTVATADRPLGSYRLHQDAVQTPGVFGNMKWSLAEAVRYDRWIRDEALGLVAQHAGIKVEGPFLVFPSYLRRRVLSWKLARAKHPYPDDSAARLWRMQLQSLRQYPGYNWIERIALAAWTAAVLVAPQPLARRFASSNTSGGVRRWIRQLAALGGRDIVASTLMRTR